MSGFGQNRKLKQALENLNDFAFMDAISNYEDLVSKGYSDMDIYRNLGNAHFLNADYEGASLWYGKLLDGAAQETEPEYMYRYAQSLKSLERYEDSDQWMTRFHEAKAEDGRAKKYIGHRDYLEDIKRKSGNYKIKNLPINSLESDFSPSFYGESMLVFASARDAGLLRERTHLWNKKPFLDFYISKESTKNGFGLPTIFSKKLNKKTHESSPAFTNNGKTIYFTRNNSKNGKFMRDDLGVSRLKIYRAQNKEGKWVDIEELPFNSDDYSVAHPSISEDGKKLYFASDMPGTIGGSDIFVVDIHEDQSFGKPMNLGPEVNTEGSETFPFISERGILYFASNGHPGLGGLDIFAVKWDDLQNALVVNLGEPINSCNDDFSLIVRESTGIGYFASNRVGGKGSDDIYVFVEVSPISWMDEGIVDIESIQGDDDIVENMIDQSSSSEEKLSTPVSGTDLLVFLDLSPVYFDMDSSEIRNDAIPTLQSIVKYMKAFPGLRVKVLSHTDVHASHAYNQKLSDRRALATVRYLVKHGISSDRLVGEGRGELELVNDCTFPKKCPDRLHQLNRRSEFVILD